MTASPPPTPPPGAPPAVREPHLFRFGLRQMFACFSGATALIAAMAVVGGGWAATLGFSAALVAAHVLATSVGTRLRDSSREIQLWNAGRLGATPDGPPSAAALAPADAASLPASTLAKFEIAPWRSIVAGALGLVVGGALGASAMPFIAGPQTSLAGLAVGAASCGVIGGWLALLLANFWAIARRAWRDANGVSSGATRRKLKRWRALGGVVEP